MAVIECSRCGGRLEINADMSVGTCMYCGSVITIPKSWEKKSNLYNRANYLRQSNEFDKAAEIFEDILKEDNTEAEAHWGALMCMYGIEYVEDPVSHERIPTCHRTERDSIFTQPSYLAAMQYADEMTKEVYTEQAQRIDKIQQKILRIAEQEEPYDVFICYKQGDDATGERTPDSYIGEDLYYELTRGGYKVFFAQQSLKPGTDYEPYIFSALYSAKVLVVIGTNEDYVNAVWVRNEWSRFLAMMKKDPDKTIIPVYKDMNPYDFPKELGCFHAMDVTRMGFLQEIRDGINRIVRKPQKLEMPQSTQTRGTTTSGVNVAGLLKRAYLFIEDGDFNSAASYFDKVLDQTPEEGQAYWGQLMVELKCRNNKDIAKKSIDLSRYGSYQKALRFSTENMVNEYTAIRKQCMDNIRRDQEEKEMRERLAKEKEARRVKYHNDFDTLKRKYSKKETSSDPIFAKWQEQKKAVDRATGIYNAVGGGKSVSKKTIWISILVLILPALLLDYAMKHPQILNNEVVAGIGVIVIVLPLMILVGMLLYGIISIFVGDPGCIAWIIIIVGAIYGGGGIIAVIGEAFSSLMPTLMVKPFHLILPLIGIILIIVQIVRKVKLSSLKSLRDARWRELQEQKNILDREWKVVQEHAYQEVAALNQQNSEFAKELHQGSELFS